MNIALGFLKMSGKEAIRPRAEAKMAVEAERAHALALLSARACWGGFFFETNALGAALEAVRTALADGAALIIEGESGAGKTVFLAELARTNAAVCHLELRYPTGEGVLSARLAQSFGAAGGPIFDVGALVERITVRSGDAIPLILIDDAQCLSSFALRALLELHGEVRRRGGRLGLALSAPQDELSRHIARMPSFAAYRAAFTPITLPRLTREETREYLRLVFKVGDDTSANDVFNEVFA
ncbi:MAG: ATP-binding protein, partial [Chromatiales bacterium]|nr:ATP-binding protein [Chromatiales bacterium]